MKQIKTSEWQGNCNIDFFNSDSSSVEKPLTVFNSKVSSPFKLIKSKNDDDGRSILPILHTAGGLVGGDLLVLNINLEKFSKVLLTTASAQKVYGTIGRSKVSPNGSFASQQIKIDILENSHLEFLPQETIVFADGLYQQSIEVNLTKNSSFIFSDLVRLGRTSIGESIQKGKFISKLEIKRREDLFDDWEFVDQIELTKENFTSKTGMDNMPVFGSFVWICKKNFPKDKIDNVINEIKIISVNSLNEVSFGYLENGLSIRVLGHSTQDARNCFFCIWKQIRYVSGFCNPEYQGCWPLQDVMNY